MKKLTALILMLISLFAFYPQKIEASSTGYFVVTAYYSPLPNQSAYIMWSYEAELRMNGMWIRWASGKKVFPWMLAAPQTYSFGTKIYLAWIGVGEVADRWGAIVPKGQRGFKHDRIDVWMWHGEEGLRRAMYWGNRTVKGYITKRNSHTTIWLKNHPAPVWATAWLKKVSNIYNVWIGKHSPEATVKKLQDLLTKTGFYKWEINGDYTSVMPIIYKFQRDNWLVTHESTLWAGYWGAITRSLFLKKYLNGSLKAPNQTLAKHIPDTQVIEKSPAEIKEVAEVPQWIDIFSNALKTEEEYKKLQEVLWEIGLYEWELDGSYDSIREIILKYQLWKDIIESPDSVWAGHFWPTTRKTLKKDYENYKIEQEKLVQRQEEMKQRKSELEEKFKELEALAEEKAEERLSSIGTLKEWDISPAVRELQNILKELGYFDYKDTAIYGTKTKQSVFEYQVDRGLIAKESDIWAGICWPVTKWQIKNDLKLSYLEGILQENKITSEELSTHGILRF